MYQTRPDDYAAFRCLAGACPQTCCAAWEIVVDPDAQDAYLRLQHPLAAKLRRVLRVDSERDTYFAQTDGRCPFLCADGLCELQRTLGELGRTITLPVVSCDTTTGSIVREAVRR